MKKKLLISLQFIWCICETSLIDVDWSNWLIGSPKLSAEKSIPTKFVEPVYQKNTFRITNQRIQILCKLLERETLHTFLLPHQMKKNTIKKFILESKVFKNVPYI